MQLTRLIVPVAMVATVSIAALVAVTLYFARLQDESAIRSDSELLAASLANMPTDLKIFAEDNTWWDVAVRNIVLSENTQWLEETIGDSVGGNTTIDGVFILRPDGSVLFWASRDDLEPPIDAMLSAGLGETIDGLVPQTEEASVTDGGVLLQEATLYALGISMVQPAGYVDYDPPLGAERRPVLVYYREIDDAALATLAKETGLADLNFVALSNGLPAEIAVDDIGGKTVGYLRWTHDTPGTSLLAQLALPAFVFAAAIVVALWVFVRRAQEMLTGLEAADRAKSTFLASVSHELRTPLNAIVGFAEMLRQGFYGEITGTKNKEYVNIIHTSGEHLLSVVNDILDLSKMEADEIQLSRSEFDAMPIIREAIALVEPIAAEQSVTLVSGLASARLHTDQRLMRQALINVIANAVKFTPSGGHVTVLSELTPAFFRVIVSDTGIGMTPEEMKIALEPFGQVGAIEGGKIEGTGLGLPLTQRFMTALGGSLQLHSTPGTGTSVSLYFPLPEIDQPVRQAEKATDAELADDADSHKITA